jgi:hypothetical protein
LLKGNQDEFAMAKELFNRKITLLIIELNVEQRKKLVRCSVWNIVLYDSETWALRNLERKCLDSLEIWCRWRMEKIKCSEKVTN